MLRETFFVAVVKSFVAVLCLICLMGACFRYDLGVLRETAVAHIQAWRVRMSVGLFPDGGAPLAGCEECLLLDGDFRLGVAAAHFLVADFTEIYEVPREAALNGGPLGSHLGSVPSAL